MSRKCDSTHTNQYECCRSVKRRRTSPQPDREGVSGASVARAYLSALSRGDIDAVLELAAPNGRQVDLGASGAGADLEKRRLRLESLRSAYEEIEFRLLDCWETEGRVAFRWRADGTTLCGKIVELRGLDMFELGDDGRILRHWLDLRPERYFPELEQCGDPGDVAGRFGWGSSGNRSRPGLQDTNLSVHAGPATRGRSRLTKERPPETS